MTSIRDHAGPVFVCGSCGQPAFESEHRLEHFHEQWDGVFCPWFPPAGKRLVVEWDSITLDTLRAQYPDTYPRDTSVVLVDSPIAPYPTAPRLPLVTLDEARAAVRLLQHLADGSQEGREAAELAGELGMRLPASE
jgi:hypothetical protein